MGRASIRTAVQAAIVTKGTFASGKVRIGKADALAEAEMPTALVWTGAEKIEPITLINPRRFEHELTVHVDIYNYSVASATASAEESLDSLVDGVEQAIHADVTLGGVADDCFLVACEYDLEGEAGRQLACARMEFTAYFKTLHSS